MRQLSRYFDLVAAQVSTGATNVVELATDNCEGIYAVGSMNTTAAGTCSLAVKMGATTTGFVSCASTHTVTSTAAGQTVVVKDVYHPAKRYIGLTLSCTAALPTRLCVWKYGLRKPVTTMSATANITVAGGGVSRSISPSSAT